MGLARKLERQDIRELARLIGRDEMNLAEFPITLLTERVPDGLKTIEFQAGGGKLVVSGSDDYGLPTAADGDVIVGLIQLTKIRNDFTDPAVDFTRYELLKLLGWPDRGAYYQRLDDSLHRWVGVTLRYDEAWWDNEIKCRVNAAFHILESVVIIEPAVRKKLRARGRQQLPSSQFTWNKIFFRSCQADNLKRLDLGTYLSLESAVSKQMYRFLDKRFYARREWTFDLRAFAFGHIGLSPNYTAAKIKEKLQPAIDELEAIGFIAKMDRDLRYEKVARGEWKITLARSEDPKAKGRESPPGIGELEQALIARGVTPVVAAGLAGSPYRRKYPRTNRDIRLALGEEGQAGFEEPRRLSRRVHPEGLRPAERLRVEDGPGEETGRRARAEAAGRGSQATDRGRGEGPRGVGASSRERLPRFAHSRGARGTPGRGTREGGPVFRPAVSPEQRR